MDDQLTTIGASDEDTERAVVLGFLERLLDDLEAGRVRGLEDYLRDYPEREGRITEAWTRFHDRGDGGEEWHPLPRMLGEYQLLERLGRGATGAVYRARAPWGDEVALKLCFPTLTQDSAAVARLRREARLAQEIDHPHVLRVLEHGTMPPAQTVFLVSPYARNGSLGDHVMREGPLEVGPARRILVELLRGLHALQSAGLIHRDVKPQNVLLFEGGRACLGDLGLARPVARHATRVTQPGLALGTREYASPEQIDGGIELDIRSDLYALGATVRAVLGEHDPGAELGAVLDALVEEDRARRPESPAAVLAMLGESVEPEAPSDPATGRRRGSSRLLFGIVAPAAATEEAHPVSRRPAPYRIEVESAHERVELTLHPGTRMDMGRSGRGDRTGQLVLPFEPSKLKTDQKRQVSRLHCRIEITDGLATIHDLGSTVGTLLERRRVEPDRPVVLAPRNEVRVAEVLSLAVRVQDVGEGLLPSVTIQPEPAVGVELVALVPHRLMLGGGVWLRPDARGLWLCATGEKPEPVRPGSVLEREGIRVRRGSDS